jgi:hypothetical protein
MMNKELLAASALLVQSVALLVSRNGFINFFAILQVKPAQVCSAPVQQPAKLLKQHSRHLKANFDLISAFEKVKAIYLW